MDRIDEWLTRSDDFYQEDPMAIYYVRHQPNGEAYAVSQSASGQIIGVCGPLQHDEITAANLEQANFNFTSEDVDWFIAEDNAGKMICIQPTA